VAGKDHGFAREHNRHRQRLEQWAGSRGRWHPRPYRVSPCAVRRSRRW
jgi:hypothetical protein